MRPISTAWSWFKAACVALTLLLANAALPFIANAQQPPTQHDVEAAYLLRFASFLREPAGTSSASGNFNLCVLGTNPFDTKLHDLAEGERVNDRPVTVLLPESTANARRCSILFISDSEAARLHEVMDSLRGADVLTVSDMPHFLERGGMIQFMLLNQRVRFGINLDAVSESRLALSSELIRVAASVTGTPKGEKHP